MFSATEFEYVTALVEQMRGQGYLYYIARTVTDNNSRYDVECVFSKEEITGNSLTSFSVPADAITYQIDSSGYTIGGSNYNQNNGPRVAVSNRSAAFTYTFADTEFAYSNAVFSGGTVLPDLRRREAGVYENTQAFVWLGALLVLVLFLALLFRR